MSASGIWQHSRIHSGEMGVCRYLFWNGIRLTYEGRLKGLIKTALYPGGLDS